MTTKTQLSQEAQELFKFMWKSHYNGQVKTEEQEKVFDELNDWFVEQLKN